MGLMVDNNTASKIIKLAKAFYSDPNNVREFEEWKKAREADSKKQEVKEIILK